MNAISVTPSDTGAADCQMAGGLRLRVTQDLPALEIAWRHLDANGVSTFYQNFDWCFLWLKHVGSRRNIAPWIVAGESADGEIQFILPLQLSRKAGLRVFEALTTPQGAYAFGLFTEGFLLGGAQDWFRDHWPNILASLPAHDILRLVDAPELVAGFANPVVEAGSFKAANISHIMNLQADFQILMEQKRSRDTRKTIRKRDNKLEASGTVSFGLPTSEGEIIDTLNVMFADQEKRLAEAGVHHVFSDDERTFIRALSCVRRDDRFLMRPYTLRIDDVIQSVLLGACQNRTYWALIISLADTPQRRFSPGDYVLRGAFKSLGPEGVGFVDFSPGDAVYKSHWSDTIMPLHLVLRASTLRGMAYGVFLLAREKIKRIVKSTPILRLAAFALRKMLAGR